MKRFYMLVASATLAMTSAMAAEQLPLINSGDSKTDGNTEQVTYTKKVVVEELTSTACGYCPRGTVSLDMWHKTYGERVIPIAVHCNMQGSQDPMYIEGGDYYRGLGVSGLPGGRFNRKIGVIARFMSPSEITPYLEGVATAQASFDNVKYDPATREVEVNYFARMGYTNTTRSLSMAAVLVEDSVRGTTTNYKQANYYSLNPKSTLVEQYGEDWWPAWQKYAESPANIAAKNMVYNHVARGIYPSVNGQFISSSWECDNDIAGTIKFNMPKAVMNEKNTLVVLLLIDSNTGEIVGADYMGYDKYDVPLYGDSNDNGFITIDDVVADAMYILGENPTPFSFVLADVNHDDVINDVDVNDTIALILAGSTELPDAPSTTKEGCKLTCDKTILGEDKSMVISTGDMESMTAVQGDIELPEGLKISNISLAGAKDGEHSISYAELPDGKIRFVVYSMAMTNVADNQPLLNIEFEYDNTFVSGNALISNILVANDTAELSKLDNLDVEIFNPASIDVIDSADSFISRDIYNFQGVCLKRNASQEDVDALTPGLYIIGGQKVIIR